MESLLKHNKKGQTGGLVTGLVMGVAAFVIGVIVALAIVTTLTGAGLFTAGSDADTTVGNLSSNLTSGIDTVALKIPTIFTVAAVVLIIGVLAVLVAVWARMRLGQGSAI